MAITTEERLGIVNSVLAAIRTNSMTVDQLTPVTSLADSDSFEISGGKRVTYAVLSSLIASLLTTEQDAATILIELIEKKTGAPNGLAPLDADAKLPWVYLPGRALGTIEFSGTVAGVTAEAYIADKGFAYGGALVKYDTTANRFVLEVTDGDTTTYYRNWFNSSLHGWLDASGSVMPLTNKVFILPANGLARAYVWGGSQLVQLATDFMLDKALALKADKTTMTTELAKKADQSYVEDVAVGLQSSIQAVSTAVSKKVNTTTYTAGMATKADKTDMTALAERVAALEQLVTAHTGSINKLTSDVAAIDAETSDCSTYIEMMSPRLLDLESRFSGGVLLINDPQPIIETPSE